MTKFSNALMMSALAATFALAGIAEAREGRVRARGTNGVAAAGAGSNGGAYVRGRGAVQNDDGSVTGASGAAFRGPNGASGARASTTTVNPDGSATRQGGFAAQGVNGGSVESSGSAVRNSDGTYAGSRSTQATGASGNTYQGDTSYDSATGVTHNSTCADASGAVIACPTR